jgi:hypothetical protein
LLAVVDKNSTIDNHHESLNDGTWIQPAIDLSRKYYEAVNEKSAIALANLQAAESILRGMINSDGVVVFGSSGTILAFRVFMKANECERGMLPEKGGGRRRTYELMKVRTGDTLRAALFRSQDGETQCEGERHE